MMAWRKIIALLGAAALSLGMLGTAASTANAAEADNSGGIEIWGDQTRSIPASEGPFVQLDHSNYQLAITANGKIKALRDDALPLPQVVQDGTTVSATRFNINAAIAALDDGSVHVWGGNRGTVLRDGDWSAQDLGGKAVQVAGYAPQTATIVLENGHVVQLFGANKDPFPVENDDGDPLTGVTRVESFRGDVQFVAFRDDGTVAAIDPDGIATPMGWDSQDPVIDFTAGSSYNADRDGTAVTEAGTVLTVAQDGTVTEDDRFPADQLANGEKVIQVARGGMHGATYNYVGYGLTNRGNIIVWNVLSDSDVPEKWLPPASVTDRPIYEIRGTSTYFWAIVGERDGGGEEEIVNADRPSIDGTPEVGEELSTDGGAWEPSDVDLSYQWLRDGNDISGATQDTYTLTADDKGAKISVKVTASKDGYTSASKTSSETDPIQGDGDGGGLLEGKPEIKGDPVVGGDPLQFLAADWVGEGRPNNSYQWYVGDGDDFDKIEGETSGTLTLKEEYVGQYIRIAQTATEGDTSETVWSEPFGPIEAADGGGLLEGKPEIKGDPVVGGDPLQFLAADWVGEGRPNNSYQWYVGDGDDFDKIEGETSGTLTLKEEYVGQYIRIAQTATEGDTTETVWSEPFGPIKSGELKVTEKSQVDGTPVEGETITGVPAEFNQDDVDLSYQWFVDGAPLTSATGETLRLTSDMVGKKITFVTTGEFEDQSEASESEAFGPVKAKLAVESQPSIEGTPEVGAKLTGTPAEFNDADADVSNQWFADDTAIPGETGGTLTLTEDQLGKQITYKSTATRGDEEVSSESDPTDKVEKAPLKVDKDATISGTPEVGKTLTGTPAEFSDPDADVVNQWLADGEPIDGANGKKLTLTKQMLGKKITFKSTATRDGDEPVSSVSNAVTVVEAGSGEEEGPSEPGKGVKDKQDEISVLPSTTLHPGQEFAVKFDDDLAGEKVSIWMFSEKFDLGTHTVGKNGRVSVTVPEDISLGAHKVAAYDADGDLIGWVNVKVVAEPAVGPGTSAGGLAGALPSTGSEWLTNVLAPAGVLLLLAGGGALLVSRRRRHA